jgi:hypothetical protein
MHECKEKLGNPMDKTFREAKRAQNDCELRIHALELAVLAVDARQDCHAYKIVEAARHFHRFLRGEGDDVVQEEVERDDEDTEASKDEDHFLYQMGYHSGYQAASLMHDKETSPTLEVDWGKA